MLKVLFIGDVVGEPGCNLIRQMLPGFKRKCQVDVVIANGENSALGNGILPFSADFLLDSGVDVITTGNHVFKRRQIYSYLDHTPQVIRPANFPQVCNGNGYYVYEKAGLRFCIINLLGMAFMEPTQNPFYIIDDILQHVRADCYFVDFHAESTGEKKALAYYLDGRVAFVVGTHTHVQTADEQILSKGTGFITDAGMTGPIDSVLGVDPLQVIERYRTGMPVRFEVPDIACKLDGVLIDIDRASGMCHAVRRIHLFADQSYQSDACVDTR